MPPFSIITYAPYKTHGSPAPSTAASSPDPETLIPFSAAAVTVALIAEAEEEAVVGELAVPFETVPEAIGIGCIEVSISNAVEDTGDTGEDAAEALVTVAGVGEAVVRRLDRNDDGVNQPVELVYTEVLQDTVVLWRILIVVVVSKIGADVVRAGEADVNSDKGCAVDEIIAVEDRTSSEGVGEGFAIEDETSGEGITIEEEDCSSSEGVGEGCAVENEASGEGSTVKEELVMDGTVALSMEVYVTATSDEE